MIDDVLMTHVRLAFAESGGTYGAPRIERELRAEGLPTSTKRVARLMREAGLVAPQVTTARGHDRLGSCRAHRAESTCAAVRRAGHGGESHLGRRHHLRANARRLPLSGDRAGSRITALRRLGDARHAGGRRRCKALQMACEARRPAPGLIFHSDRGSQYASAAYRARLEARGSRNTRCWRA